MQLQNTESTGTDLEEHSCVNDRVGGLLGVSSTIQVSNISQIFSFLFLDWLQQMCEKPGCQNSAHKYRHFQSCGCNGQLCIPITIMPPSAPGITDSHLFVMIAIKHLLVNMHSICCLYVASTQTASSKLLYSAQSLI